MRKQILELLELFADREMGNSEFYYKAALMAIDGRMSH
jgi:hypothetical protein